MKTIQDFLALGSILATVVVGIISWFLSAYLTKRNRSILKINYEIKLYPIISKNFLKDTGDIKVEYKGELLPEPTLLAVDIMNSGNVSIEHPPIEVEAKGATYIIPGYIEEVPPGYEDLWTLERTDAESCAIRLEHINPGQVVKARFLLDEFPKETPVFKCPMKDVIVKEVNTEIKRMIVKNLMEAFMLTVRR